MRVTGVDWSGDAGFDSEGPGVPGLLCFAFVTIDAGQYPSLHASLAELRRAHNFDEGHAFKHLKSNAQLKRDFFRTLQSTEMQIRVLLVDKKRDWSSDLWRLRGNDRLAASIAEAEGRLPHEVVSEQTLLVDLDQKRDGRFCTQIIKVVHRSTRSEGRPGFKKIRCCPDTDRFYGEILQVADMVAGAVRRSRTVDTPDQPDLSGVLFPW